MAPGASKSAERRGALALLTNRDRAQALGLAAAFHVGAVVLLMLLQGAPAALSELEERLTVFEIAPPPEPEPPPPLPDRPAAAAPRTLDRPEPQMLEMAAPAPVAPPLLFPPTVAVPPGEASSSTGSTGEGEMGRGTGSGAAGAGSGGGDSGGGVASGEGEDRVLLTGRWARQPSASDFRPPPNLVPGAPKTGWGEMICRTARNNRLVDCVVHAEFPEGSGFAEAMRVTAPRFRYTALDSAGKPVVGYRVLVHLNFLEPKRR